MTPETSMEAFMTAAVVKSETGSTRTSENYDKAAKELLKLAKARKWSFFAIADYFAAIKAAGLIQKAVPSKEEYGYRNFRIGYVYPATKKIINGTLTNAIIRAGKYYVVLSGSMMMIIPESEWPARKKAYLKKNPAFVELLEANYKAMYPTVTTEALIEAAVASSAPDK